MKEIRPYIALFVLGEKSWEGLGGGGGEGGGRRKHDDCQANFEAVKCYFEHV